MNPKNRLRAFCTATAMAAALITSACAPSQSDDKGNGNGSSNRPQDGGSITIGVSEPLTTWNVTQALTTTDFQVLKEVFEPLVVNNAVGNDIQGALADRFGYNKTRMVLTFELPPEAAFADGTPLTSADVAFSVDMWKSGGYGHLYASIKSVKTPDEHKVLFHLSAPNSSLLPVLTWASSAVVKKDFGGKSAEEYFSDPVGSGPFMVDNYAPGSNEIVLKKNPNYHDKGRPRLDSVTYKVVADPNQRVLQYKSGEIDVYEQVSPDLVAQLPKDEIAYVPSAALSGIAFNVRDSAGITGDVNFRKAVSMALDRQVLVDSVLAGHAIVARSALIPQVPGALPCEACDYELQSVTGAKAALAASDYRGQPVEMVVDSSKASLVLTAQAIQPMLKAIGINMTVKPQDLTTIISRASTGDFEMVMSTYQATSLTLNDMLSFWASTEGFFSGEDTGPILEGAAAVAAAQDGFALEDAAKQIEQFTFESKFWVPVADLNNIFAINPRVEGLSVNPLLMYNLSDVHVTS